MSSLAIAINNDIDTVLHRLLQDRVGNSAQVGANEAVSIDTQYIQTEVLIGNGQTLVLGGIYQLQNITEDDEVPGLGSLPIVVGLFKSTYKQLSKKELIIFVTSSVLPEKRFYD